MRNKANTISAKLLELDLKVQLYNPFFDIFFILRTNFKIPKLQKEPKCSGKVGESSGEFVEK